VRKTYENTEIDTSHPAVPEQVSVALAELAATCARAYWPSRSEPGCR
jgi:hypothetical protein